MRIAFGAIAIVLVLAATAVAQQKVKTEPVKPVAPSDAAGMFQSYCSACHGKDAKGNGPAAAAMTKKPADLTTISARNGGKFPDVKVTRYIQGLDEVAAHGSRDMPVWGPVFRSLGQDTAEIRVSQLVAYLKSLQ
jgi:mono/diheme cytochrome c family protein